MNQKTNGSTFEEATFVALAMMHGQIYGTGEHQVHRNLPKDDCETCTALMVMQQHVEAQRAPEITDDEAQLMGELMLIEHELAEGRAVEDFENFGIKWNADPDPWTQIECAAYLQHEREPMRKAVLYLKHRRRIDVHPDNPNLVRLKVKA